MSEINSIFYFSYLPREHGNPVPSNITDNLYNLFKETYNQNLPKFENLNASEKFMLSLHDNMLDPDLHVPGIHEITPRLISNIREFLEEAMKNTRDDLLIKEINKFIEYLNGYTPMKTHANLSTSLQSETPTNLEGKITGLQEKIARLQNELDDLKGQLYGPEVQIEGELVEGGGHKKKSKRRSINRKSNRKLNKKNKPVKRKLSKKKLSKKKLSRKR